MTNDYTSRHQISQEKKKKHHSVHIIGRLHAMQYLYVLYILEVLSWIKLSKEF